MKDIRENPSTSKKIVYAALREMMIEENSGSKLNFDEDATKLVAAIVQSLRNHAIKSAGKNTFRFSPHLMGLVMNQYLQGPTAYDRFRESAAFVCPSPNSLKKKKIDQTVLEGDNVELYERIQMFMSTSEMIGQLICDEMKAKGDIAFGTTSNTVKGFTEDFASARKLFEIL